MSTKAERRAKKRASHLVRKIRMLARRGRTAEAAWLYAKAMGMLVSRKGPPPIALAARRISDSDEQVFEVGLFAGPSDAPPPTISASAIVEFYRKLQENERQPRPKALILAEPDAD